MVTFTRPVIAIVILFSSEALETVIVPKLEAVPLGLKIGFLLDLDGHAGKLLQDRTGFDGFTRISSAIIVDVVQNIILLRARKKDANFIALLNGLCFCRQEIRAYLSDRSIQTIVRQLGGKPDAAQPQHDSQNAEDHHQFRQRIS